MPETISPVDRREQNLDEIRRQAELYGQVDGAGVRPAGSPFPLASPQTGYYEQPLLKEPQWTQLIPFYFFVGGAAGSLGVIGSLADILADDSRLARDARYLAFGGAVLSGVLLVADLGRPSRFLNMLRVFKPQSTMSMGSWILSGFSVFASASTFADVLEHFFGLNVFVHLLRGAGRIGSVALGMPFHNYTGVLLATTALPVWNERADSLAGHFGMSGLQAGASILELMGHDRNRALNWLGLLSASMETWEKIEISSKKSQALLPLKKGTSGALVSAGAWLSGPVSIVLRLGSLFTKREGMVRRLAACAGIAGSMFTRYGWVEAGKPSARDWRLPLEIEAPESDRKPKGNLFAGSTPKKPSSAGEKARNVGAALLLLAALIGMKRRLSR